jgi:hypothetical protein
MNEDEILEFNYRSARKSKSVELHRIFAIYDSADPFYLDLDKASIIQPYIKDGIASGTMIKMNDSTYGPLTYYAQESYEYVRSFISYN